MANISTNESNGYLYDNEGEGIIGGYAYTSKYASVYLPDGIFILIEVLLGAPSYN